MLGCVHFALKPSPSFRSPDVFGQDYPSGRWLRKHFPTHGLAISQDFEPDNSCLGEFGLLGVGGGGRHMTCSFICSVDAVGQTPDNSSLFCGLGPFNGPSCPSSSALLRSHALLPDEFSSITPRFRGSHYSRAGGEHSNKQMKSASHIRNTHTQLQPSGRFLSGMSGGKKKLQLLISDKINRSTQTHGRDLSAEKRLYSHVGRRR